MDLRPLALDQAKVSASAAGGSTGSKPSSPQNSTDRPTSSGATSSVTCCNTRPA
jgi:hypothetical protein